MIFYGFIFLLILLKFPLYALAHLLFTTILCISSTSVYANRSSEKKSEMMCQLVHFFIEIVAEDSTQTGLS